MACSDVANDSSGRRDYRSQGAEVFVDGLSVDLFSLALPGHQVAARSSLAVKFGDFRSQVVISVLPLPAVVRLRNADEP